MNLDTLTSMAGQSIDVAQLGDLNKALRASGNTLAKANVGTVQQGQAFGVVAGSELAPLVPQSIQNTLDSATYTEQAVKFWAGLPKTSVSSTLHESVVVSNYGSMNLDPWIAEGGAGVESTGDYARQVVQIKFLAERREISDVATMVGIVGYQGVSRQGLAQQTIDGTRALMGKLERSLFLADDDLTTLAFNGLYKQISGHTYTTGTTTLAGFANANTAISSPAGANRNYTDFDGADLTIQRLINEVYTISAAPNFGLVNKIMVDPRVYSGLVTQASLGATGAALFDPNQAARGQLIFGTEGLMVAGPSGMIKIESCPLMQHPVAMPTASQGNTTAGSTLRPDAPVVSQVGTRATAAGEKGFTATTAGTFNYKVVGVNEAGLTVSAAFTSQAVAAGNIVQLGVADEATTDATYYRVYRSAAGAAATDANLQYMWSFPKQNAAATAIIDDNSHIPGTAPVYFIQQTPDVMYWAQLLDFLRRPLAQVQTSIPFLLMLFGALHVKVPTKCSILDNCALTAI
jgi:hypothetical protein